MRKRSGRPQRFAAVPNETVDDAERLDLTALGLLTVLIRHRDGWVITLAEIGLRYGYTREAMARAMGLLQVARYVVKVKMMSADSNQWSTEVYVYDTPATDNEVAALLAEIERSPEVRRVQLVEPTAAAYEYAAKRREKSQVKQRKAPSVAVPRVQEIQHSGMTCGNAASSQVAPECGFPRLSGDPAVTKKTVQKKTREKTTAPSARSAPDAGGSTSGSRDRAASGSAAPGQTQQRLTIEQKQAVQRVRDLLPREFDRALPIRTPRAVADAVLDALAAGTPSSRTPEQLVQYRVAARWDGYWAPRFLAGEVDSPIGVLRALMAPASRDHDRCDERVNVDTGEACVPCQMRARDRAEQRREEAAQVARAVPGRGAPMALPPRQRSFPRSEPYDAAQKQPQPVVVTTEPMGDYTSGASAARAEMRSKKADAHRRANLLYKAT